MPKVNNALLKNTNGKGKLQKMLSLLLVEKDKIQSLQRLQTCFLHIARPFLDCSRSSKVYKEFSGIFHQLRSRELRFTVKLTQP